MSLIGEASDAEGMIRLGLVGRGIQGSRSPSMHMQEGAAQGLRLSYVLLDMDLPPQAGLDLAAVIAGAEREGLAGVNVTHPYKQQIIPLLDELSPDARRLGAVNTVLFRAGRRIGHNTDWSGFAENFRRGLPGVALDRVVQVGGGGAGAAVAYALLQHGVGRLTLFDLDAARAGQLVGALQALFGPDRVAAGTDLAKAIAEADGVTNATPVGMAEHPGIPLPSELLRPDLWVAEVIYFPIETALLAAARRTGCRTVDGGGMAVYQAVEAFRLFTGVTPDMQRMRARFLKEIECEGGAGARA